MALITNAKTLGADTGKYTVVVDCLAGNTITAKQNVMLDISGAGITEHRTVIPDTGTAYFVGVALEAASAGDTVRVAVAGWVDNAVGDGSVSAGEAIIPKTGSVFDSYANTSVLPIVGVALEDDAPAMAIRLNGYGLGLLGNM